MTILQERIYPQISDSIYQTILDATSYNDKPNSKTKWICQQYIDGKIGSLDDGIIPYEIHDLLYCYDKYKNKLKPIMDYKDQFELEDDITKIRNDGYKTNSELDKLARKGAIKVYNDNEFIVYKIETIEACRKYGSNTTWCLTNRLDDYSFNSYKKAYDGEIYFILDKHNKDLKYACVGNLLYTEMDETILAVPETIDKFTTRQVSSDELYWRTKENPKLKEVITYGFPKYDKDIVLQAIDKTCSEMGGEFSV